MKNKLIDEKFLIPLLIIALLAFVLGSLIGRTRLSKSNTEREKSAQQIIDEKYNERMEKLEI